MELAEGPCPLAMPGQVLVRTTASVISAGTERMLVEFSQANLIQKARQQPEKVRQVLDKIRTDGLLPTLDAVFRKLDEPLPLGYCNAGTVVEVGTGVTDLVPGDRVASNGPHAEWVSVPRNLCAKIPDGVPDDQAAFGVLGSIALQGVRLTAPTLGERFLVFGAGLLGLLTVQLLRASGCEVLAVDLNAGRLELAEQFGAKTVNVAAGGDPVAAALAWTNGQGVDGALITASAKSDAIMRQAAEACRKRGRIVLVGVVGLNLRRDDFYKKELTFQVSCSYGPGRYDESYEQAGRDYPLPYVRWTEQRNIQAVLDSLAARRLCVDRLISHRYPFADAVSAYQSVQNDPTALGVVLEYPTESDPAPVVHFHSATSTAAPAARVAVIGAGGFAKAVSLPALTASGARITHIADLNSAAAGHAARKFGAAAAVSDYRLALDDPQVDAVFVVVGHHLHARLVCEALDAGKHVFVEKPLAIERDQLTQVVQAAERAPDRLLMVGFNRRFSTHTVRIKQLLAARSEPLAMSMMVNAGAIPADHWIQDPSRGGGRIVGEGCHFIDLLAHLADSPVTQVTAVMMGEGPAVRGDKMTIGLGFADGSVGTVNYFANGAKNYPKETLEVFSDGRVLRMENFRVTRGYGFRGFRKFKTMKQDKGHRAEIAAFVERVKTGGEPLIPLEELVNVTEAAFIAAEGRGRDLGRGMEGQRNE